MHKLTWLLALGLFTFITLTGYSQAGADPAVTAASALPNPASGVGGSITLSFSLGNNGSSPISGVDASNQMGFAISLGKAGATPDGLGALTGTILSYFDVGYYDLGNGYFAYIGQQKTGVAIPANTLLSAIISASVAVATDYSGPNSAVADIGASCNIFPNPTASPQDGTNDFLSAYTRTAAPMPVALVSFTAETQSDKTVAIRWQTSMESGNKGYIIERSKDLTSFEPVGSLTDVTANSNTLQSYRIADPAPYKGTSYYRLKQLDLTGAVHAYPAVAVNVDGVYNVYPNPLVSNSSFTLSLDEPANAVVNLYSTTGKQLSLTRSVTSEASMLVKPVETLPAGIYVLQVAERGQVRTYRLVVTNGF